MNEDIQRRIKDIISEIERKSSGDNYIYRGEPEDYGKVSSNLWREYGIEGENFDIEIIQREMLSGAKKHIGDLPQDFRIDLIVSVNASQEESDKTIDFEILTKIQHYGGQTNLIDFTTDYLIALFFACDGHHDKEGRVILQKTEEIQNIIERPQNPRHRVIAQKSIFVRPPKGYIDKPHEDNIVMIPGDLKQWILRHLETYHAISKATIYNDLYGFIKHQDIHGDAYTQFYKGYACLQRGDEATTSEERQKEYEKSIRHFTQAIILEPNFFEAYHNRGVAYSTMEQYDQAIEDFNETIRLHPSLADAYHSRGKAYQSKGENNSAIEDFNKAIELNPNYAEAYNNRGIVYKQTGDYDRAIANYNKAIELNPSLDEVYHNRGVAYGIKEEYERAIEDLNKVIDLNPNSALTYYDRGVIWLRLREWEKAKSDLTTANEKEANIVDEFRNDYESIEVFEERYGIQLPADIAEILRPTES